MEFEKKGIPTTTICSDEFVDLGKAEARAAGMPYIALITVPHPIGGIALKEVVKKADDALGDLINLLTMPRDKLAERMSEPS